MKSTFHPIHASWIRYCFVSQEGNNYLLYVHNFAQFSYISPNITRLIITILRNKPLPLPLKSPLNSDFPRSEWLDGKAELLSPACPFRDTVARLGDMY